jgi:hypothetical protein
MKYFFGLIMEGIGCVIFIFFFLLIMWWINRQLSSEEFVKHNCQFCDKEMYYGYWFKRGWCCENCWDKFGLEDRCKPFWWKPTFKIAEIEIEEIPCNGKL